MVSAIHLLAPDSPERSHDGVRVVCLDFEQKSVATIDLAAIASNQGPGSFVWIDVDLRDERGATAAFESLAVLEDGVLRAALAGDAAVQLSKHAHYYHLVLAGAGSDGDRFELERVDVVLGERFMLTAHRGSVEFLDVVRQHYRADFQRFARSPSFLLYEVFDHLLENYLAVRTRFEARVFSLQSELIKGLHDDVFVRVSALGTDLLRFRKVLVPTRELLTALATRKSLFVSEATQSYLENMVSTVDRIMSDLLADRDILSDSLNLHMSRIGHRTNNMMNRLTAVSVVFLPLTFLCGVYGMNFEVLPETKWRYGYLFFWGLAAVISGTLIWLLRRRHLL